MDDERKFWARIWVAIIAALASTIVGVVAVDDWYRVQAAKAVVEMRRNGADPIAAACGATDSRSMVCITAAARGR